MKKLNDIETYIIEHWEDIVKLQKEVNNFRDKIIASREKIREELKTKEWWKENNFEEIPYTYKEENAQDLHICKENWKYGPERLGGVSIYIGDFSLDGLLGFEDGTTIDAGIWLGWRLGKEKRDLILKQLSMDLKGFKTAKNQLYYYPHTPEEWIQILKNGQLEEEIVKIFDTLAEQCIEPIDRVVARVLGKKSRKK
ncbi:MAG: hypothetical protein ACUVTF_09225 [bacterium]